MSALDARLTLLGGYGTWAAEVAARPGELSFAATVESGALDLEEWKRRGRARVSELLGPLPAGDPAHVRATPPVRVVRRARRDGLDIEELAWQLPFGPPTEAVLLMPAGERGPLPGVLALHDHGGLKRFGAAKIAQAGPEIVPFIAGHRALYYGGAAWANDLARRGFAVLAFDAFPFGSRRVLASDVPAHVCERLLAHPAGLPPLTAEAMDARRRCTDVDPRDGDPVERFERYEAFADGYEDVLARSIAALGYTFPGLTLSDDLAALDVLASRPEVDPRRLGCCGLSGGGLRACFLAGLCDRIQCAVTAGFMSTWKDFALWNGYIHTWGLFVPHLARVLDFPEVLSLRAPLPSLVLACDDDIIFDPAEARRAEAMIAAVYRRAGAPGNVQTRRYPCPHSFSRTMQEDAFGWLERRLGHGGMAWTSD